MNENDNLVFCKWLIFFFLIFIYSCSSDELSVDHLSRRFRIVDSVYVYADTQIRYLCHNVELNMIVKSNGKESEITPVSINHVNGKFVMKSAYDWRSGFFAGLLWQMYEKTHNYYWFEKAKSQTLLIEEADTFSKHDLGFMINNSFGKAYAITKEDRYKQVVVRAADTLKKRFNKKVGCIKSWDSDEVWGYRVIIDNMMNLELLFNATQLTGDSSYYKIAVSHADCTMVNHFRPDFSSYHVVGYDSITGKVKKRGTAQGFSDESIWSRGQAWGLYGFTMCYRYTKDVRYLTHAIKIAKFLLGLSYADDKIPFWDMAAPNIPNTARDASSASIMASALIELSLYAGDLGGAFVKHAVSILQNLQRSYQSPAGDNYGFLLLHSTSNYPHNQEVDVPLIYADYYYLEALARLNEMN